MSLGGCGGVGGGRGRREGGGSDGRVGWRVGEGGRGSEEAGWWDTEGGEREGI